MGLRISSEHDWKNIWQDFALGNCAFSFPYSTVWCCWFMPDKFGSLRLRRHLGQLFKRMRFDFLLAILFLPFFAFLFRPLLAHFSWLQFLTTWETFLAVGSVGNCLMMRRNSLSTDSSTLRIFFAVSSIFKLWAVGIQIVKRWPWGKF